jgi:3'-phosphoadenosine 5'-phosphosulfate sulfotransferase (PAPS reductase)/FAD synthetase
MKKRNILLSFIGGRSSVFLAQLLRMHPEYKNDNILIVYANSSRERKETLDFIDEADKRWNLDLFYIESIINQEKGKGSSYKIIDREQCTTDGKIFEELIQAYGLPSKLYRHCTRELKEIPIHKFAKDYFETTDYFTALGIRADEKHRISSDSKKIYPLADLNIDERFVRDWWQKQDFDLNLKDYEGNCDLCFLKSKRKKLTLINEGKSNVDWWLEMEEKYSSEQQPLFDVYRNLPIEKLIEEAKHPFRKAIDKHEQRSQQMTAFDVELDIEFDCFCKST